jgi:hypothetical protein
MALMMKTGSTAETPANFYHNTRCNIPEETVFMLFAVGTPGQPQRIEPYTRSQATHQQWGWKWEGGGQYVDIKLKISK